MRDNTQVGEHINVGLSEPTEEPKQLNKTQFIDNTGTYQHRILIGVPTRGIVHLSWAASRYGQVIPTNWSCSEFALTYQYQLSPMGFLVADARNIIAEHAIKNGIQWLIFVDDDVILHPLAFQRFTQYINEGKKPLVSGLYFTKSNPSEPLIYKGRGNGAYYDWKIGDKFWVDGCGCGCLLIHVSILRHMYDIAETYILPNGQQVRKVFDTPRNRFFDPESGVYTAEIGTEDLYFFDACMKEDAFTKEGWEIPDPFNPIWMDTSIFNGHIDINTGIVYPYGYDPQIGEQHSNN